VKTPADRAAPLVVTAAAAPLVEPAAAARLAGRAAAVPLVATVAAALLYAAFVPDLLLDWDPIQFALSLDRFSMPVHQPHPPGYLGFLAVAWAFHAAGMSAATSVQAASVAFAAASVGALAFVARRLWGGAAALVAAAAFATHPVTIFYAVSGESYAAEPLAACLLVALAAAAAGHRPPAAFAAAAPGRLSRAAVAFFLAYGLSGGIRQGLPIYFAPLAAWVLLRSVRGLPARAAARAVAVAAGAALAGVVAWLAPAAALAGGLGEWLRMTLSQHLSLFAASFSPLLGAGGGMVAANLGALGRAAASLSIPAAVAAVLAIPAALRRPSVATAPGRVPLLALWIVPPLLWFSAMWLSKPGYLLVVAPGVAVAVGAVLARALPGPRAAPAVAIAIAGAQVALFLAPPFAWSAHLSPCSLPAIAYGQRTGADALDAIRAEAAGDPGSIAVVTRYGGGLSFRAAMMHLPEARVLWLVDRESTGAPVTGVDACEGHGGGTTCVSGHGFWERLDLPERAEVRLPPAVRRVVWVGEGPFFDALSGAARGPAAGVGVREVRAGLAGTIRVSDLPPPPEPWRVEIGPYAFIR